MKQMLQLSPVPARAKFLTKSVGVYIHIPFCRKRCAYCDFYTAMCHSEVMEKYISRLKEEIYRWGGALSRPADTVYFGGGTPSVFGADILSDLLFTVKDAFKVSADAEITLELNPEDAEDEFFRSVKNAGFNRLSIGIQSLSNNTLKTLGRRHSGEDCITAFKKAREAGFDNITVDLMLSLPEQSVAESLQTAKEIVDLCPEHISCYMLILEEKTALFAKQDKLHFPDEEAISEEYLKICDIFSKNGYDHYEISNFAKPSKESRHNLKYWRAQEYIGIGPSAYSFIDGKRFHYKSDLKGFINCPETEEDGYGGDMAEYIMLALRLKEGIRESKLKKIYGKKYSHRFYEKAELFKENGLAVLRGDNFYLTHKGMLVSNSIICEMTEEDMYEDV